MIRISRRMGGASIALLLLAVAAIAVFSVYFRVRQIPDALPSSSALSSTGALIPFGGDWTANPNEIENHSQIRGAKLMTRGVGWADYQVSADVQIDEPYGGAGLIIRSRGEEDGVDAYHGYYAGIRSMDDSFEFGRADFGWHSFVHRSLPGGVNFREPIHLRLVAVGCRFAVAVTLADGRSTASVTEDPDCILTGKFGLRSYLTSATWRNLRISPADIKDVLAIEKQAAESNTAYLPSSEPFDLQSLNRLTTSLLAEAREHELRPGVQPIISFQMSPGVHPNVTIQGEIISTPPLTDIQDDSGSLIVPNFDPAAHIKIGDVVEAQGTVVSTRFRSELEDAKMRVLWSETEVPPLAVTAAQLTKTYRGRSIEVEGFLRSVKPRPDGYDLVLQDEGQIFKAFVAKESEPDPNSLQLGSRLRLRGVALSLAQFTDGIYPFAVITNHIDVVTGPPWWSPKHLALIAFCGLCFFLLIQLVLHRVQQWHLRSVLKEREQLAFEMHDTLAQSFTGIAYQLQAASAERSGELMIKNHVKNALELVHISHREASRTIDALRPQYRDAAGILSALKESADRLSDGGGLLIETTLHGKLIELPLDVTDAFFRVGQEAISNAIQHSGCSKLIITLSLQPREAQLVIEDDGNGFVEHTAASGLGLESMRKRVAKIKSRFDLRSAPGLGTSITVTAPLTPTFDWFRIMRAKLVGNSPNGTLTGCPPKN